MYNILVNDPALSHLMGFKIIMGPIKIDTTEIFFCPNKTNQNWKYFH